MANYIKIENKQPIPTTDPVQKDKPTIQTWQIILAGILVLFMLALVAVGLTMLIGCSLSDDSDIERVPYTDGLLMKDIPQAQRLVCYFTTSGKNKLSLLDVPGDLCTHINIGTADLDNATLSLSAELQDVLANETSIFHAKHPQVKLLLWIGGADSGKQFAVMVKNHAQRKIFLKSLKVILKAYPSLSGIDLDWEFPRPYDKNRQHFAQLFYEIRREWQRERRYNNILSLAVAAPEGIAYYAYNIREINLYIDYVNLMSYDFHFYAKDTPFTGLNAPLYARLNEQSIMATFNINYTAHWWLKNGLEPQKLVVGLPTYGHSFTLINPLNTQIGAPASGYGECGELGFTTLSETCECSKNYKRNKISGYDYSTCSPYLTDLQEWISYEDPESIRCKARYVKSLNVGGIMIFSLNTDDLKNICNYEPYIETERQNNAFNGMLRGNRSKPVFPLTKIAKETLK
ncbi:uncharacterized protein Dwil_GK20091 [Drosophila willistoni]|uniref:GH18 domain-containing protein n=1 Tax=Drosophila willistoni TaxID=7260 RepID=B4MT40_DROWI|nr:chitinase-3-like protein 2 [Drosophila willistoni]EDW75279.2 uncharacterized protein Dwil_GK20091 [Drosophila willistoni]